MPLHASALLAPILGLPEVTDCRGMTQIVNEVGWKKEDVRWKMSFVQAYVASILSYISHAPSQPVPACSH